MKCIQYGKGVYGPGGGYSGVSGGAAPGMVGLPGFAPGVISPAGITQSKIITGCFKMIA